MFCLQQNLLQQAQASTAGTQPEVHLPGLRETTQNSVVRSAEAGRQAAAQVYGYGPKLKVTFKLYIRT